MGLLKLIKSTGVLMAFSPFLVALGPKEPKLAEFNVLVIV